MIFHCPKCRSKYKIADRIITEKGINAKCHKCGNIFFVRKKDEMELTSVISGIKENIARWEETAKPPETEKAVVEDEESISDFISEIEFDFLKEKELPGEERLKELLIEEHLISDDKIVKEEAIEKPPEPSQDVISPELIEADKGGQPVEGETQLKLEVKPDDFPSQEDMDKFLSDLTQSPPDGEVANISEISGKDAEPPIEESASTPSVSFEGEVSAITEIAEKVTEPSVGEPATIVSPSQGGDNIDVDLDKLLDDTAAELDSKIAVADLPVGQTGKKDESGQLIDANLDDKDIVKTEDNIVEDISTGEFGKELQDILLNKSDSTVVEGGVSEGKQPEIKKEEVYEDIMPDEEDELKPKGTGIGKSLKEKWQNFTFLLSSYYSLLIKKTVLWKLAILSVVGIVIIGGVIGLVVIGGKKIISKPEEKKEAAVEAEKPQLKEPPVGEKKAEDGGKPVVVEEKSADQAPHLQEQEKKIEEQKPAPPVTENSVRLDAILPVAFSPDENKVISINVRLELENKEGADMIKSNLPYYEEVIEDSIDQFFKDKFYEDTHFVKEKLKELILRKINENIKNGRVKKVDLEELKVK